MVERKTITIPEEVDINRCYGDTESGAMFEVKPDFFGEDFPMTKDVEDAFAQGHRVFCTDADAWMFVRPE